MTSTNAGQTILLRRQLSDAVAELRVSKQFESPKTSAYANRLLRARITPLDGQDQPGTSYQINVKDFDEHGITFYHQSPLNGRRAMLVLESPRLGRLAAEVDLTWCQFNRAGRYTSGGRFVQLVGKTA